MKNERYKRSFFPQLSINKVNRILFSRNSKIAIVRPPVIVCRAGLTIRGAHTNVRRGPFSHTRSQDFLRCTFLPQKVDDLLVVVTFKPTRNLW